MVVVGATLVGGAVVDGTLVVVAAAGTVTASTATPSAAIPEIEGTPGIMARRCRRWVARRHADAGAAGLARGCAPAPPLPGRRSISGSGAVRPRISRNSCLAAPTSGVATSAPGTPAMAPPTKAATIVVGGVRSTDRPDDRRLDDVVLDVHVERRTGRRR